MPFGQLPVLEVNGRRLTQSMAIMRCIARKHGLEADDEWDRALGDELATSWLDLFKRAAGVWKEEDKAVNKQKFQASKRNSSNRVLKIMDERLLHSRSARVHRWIYALVLHCSEQRHGFDYKSSELLASRAQQTSRMKPLVRLHGLQHDDKDSRLVEMPIDRVTSTSKFSWRQSRHCPRSRNGNQSI